MNHTHDLDPAGRVDAAGVADRIADRIAERREQLGLTEKVLAHQAAMSPHYLRHLLEAGPDFDPAGFDRIAAALRMPPADLLEGRADAPPGRSGPGSRPRLLDLGEAECWDLVGGHGVGRIGLPGRGGPAVLPVNYVVDARTIVYRTKPHGAAAASDGSPVSFQVDHIDDHLGQGWSVLMLGEAQHVRDPDEQDRLASLPGATPWAGGDRPLWVRVRPDEITGRRITPL
ncbi:helix-turn-helix domain-containing protein [Kitasatospora sp. NPDC004240]